MPKRIINKSDILRTRTLLLIAKDKSKEQFVQYLEGYVQALEDYKKVQDGDESNFAKLCYKIKEVL